MRTLLAVVAAMVSFSCQAQETLTNAPKIQPKQEAHGGAKRHAKTPEQIQPPTPLPIVVNIAKPDPTKEERQRDAEKAADEATEFWTVFGRRLKITDTLLAFFNFALVIANIFLWRSTEKLWQAGEKQIGIAKLSVDAANDEFLASHRPKIIVRNIFFRTAATTATEYAQSQYAIEYASVDRGIQENHFYIANVGDSNANIVWAGIWIFHSANIKFDELPMQRPYELMDGNITIAAKLAPGESLRLETGDINLNLNTTDTTFADIPYLMGWVEYRDDRSVNRRTYFCRRWDNAIGRYRPVNDVDYEYAE